MNMNFIMKIIHWFADIKMNFHKKHGKTYQSSILKRSFESK